jgi:hypothetical protein
MKVLGNTVIYSKEDSIDRINDKLIYSKKFHVVVYSTEDQAKSFLKKSKYKYMIYTKTTIPKKEHTYIYLTGNKSISDVNSKSRRKIKLYTMLKDNIKNGNIIQVEIYDKYNKTNILYYILLIRYLIYIAILWKYRYKILKIHKIIPNATDNINVNKYTIDNGISLNKQYIQYGALWFFGLYIIDTILWWIFKTLFMRKKKTKIGNTNIEDRLKLCMEDYNNDNYTCNFKEIPTKWWDYQVSNFYIASSNKSYIPCSIKNDLSAVDNIEAILRKGARLIHLDIYHSEFSTCNANAEPVVTNNLNKEHSILFSDCCKRINEVAWNIGSTNRMNEYPIFLYLKFHTKNISVLNKVAQYIREIFTYNTTHSRLLNKAYGYGGRLLTGSHNSDGTYYRPFGMIKMNELRKKVVIFTEEYPIVNQIDELVNNVFDEKSTSSYNFNYMYKSHHEYNTMTNSDSFFDTGTTAINFNKNKLTRVFMTDKEMNSNISDIPKNSIRNINPLKPFQLGCQFICMNYQKFDKDMQNYMKTNISTTEFINTKWSFTDSPLLLKPANMRAIIRKPPSVEKPPPSQTIKEVDTGFGGPGLQF